MTSKLKLPVESRMQGDLQVRFGETTILIRRFCICFFFLFLFYKKYETIKENRSSKKVKAGGFYGKKIKTSGWN